MMVHSLGEHVIRALGVVEHFAVQNSGSGVTLVPKGWLAGSMVIGRGAACVWIAALIVGYIGYL